MVSWSGWRRRLDRVASEAELQQEADADTAGTPAYSPPIERWVEEFYRDRFSRGPELYRDEDALEQWADRLGRSLRLHINRKLVETKGERVPLPWFEGRSPGLRPEYARRARRAIEPHLQHWLVHFEEARPERERARERRQAFNRQMVAKLGLPPEYATEGVRP